MNDGGRPSAGLQRKQHQVRRIIEAMRDGADVIHASHDTHGVEEKDASGTFIVEECRKCGFRSIVRLFKPCPGGAGRVQ